MALRLSHEMTQMDAIKMDIVMRLYSFYIYLAHIYVGADSAAIHQSNNEPNELLLQRRRNPILKWNNRFLHDYRHFDAHNSVGVDMP